LLAITVLGSAQARDPKTSRFLQLADAKSEAADQVFLEAVKLYRAGDLAGAVEQFELGLSIDPNNAAGHFYLAKTYDGLKRRNDALIHYRKAAELGPGTKEGIIAAATVKSLEKKLRDKAAAEQKRVEEERKRKEVSALLSTENIDRCYKNKQPKTMLQGCNALIRYYSAKNEMTPDPMHMFSLAGAILQRAIAHGHNRDWSAAIDDFEQVIAIRKPVIMDSEFKTNNANSLVSATNGLAWLRATCPDGRYRSGAEAVRLAAEAVRMRPWPEYRDTLAAAYAEAGRFEDAASEQEAAIAMLNDRGKQLYLKKFRARLALYRQGKPYRAP